MMRSLARACLVLLTLTLVPILARPMVSAERRQAVHAVEASFVARVEHIVDGDTFDVRRSDGTLTGIRVEGVDCPERGKPFSSVASKFTRTMVFDQDVRVTPKETDRYGRLVARVRVGERDLSEALVEAGLAWQFRRYSDDPRLAALEQAARETKRGLWQLGVDPRVARDAARQPLVAGPHTSAAAIELHGNVNSRLYHRASCRNFGCKNCTRVFSSEQAAQTAGFMPAKNATTEDSQTVHASDACK